MTSDLETERAILKGQFQPISTNLVKNEMHISRQAQSIFYSALHPSVIAN